MSNLAVCDYDDGCSSCRSYRELAQEMKPALIPRTHDYSKMGMEQKMPVL